jgi:hypothetical protein
MKTHMSDMNACEGDETVALKVELSKKLTETNKIKCYFKDELLDFKSDKYTIETHDCFCTLRIKNIELKDEGSYSIQVDKAKSSADLNVTEFPAKFVHLTTDMEGFEETDVTFECEISKSKWKKTGSDVELKWFKGERELKDSFKYSIKRDGCKQSLTIKNLAFEDDCNYSVGILKETCTAHLKVKGTLFFFISFWLSFFYYNIPFYRRTCCIFNTVERC